MYKSCISSNVGVSPRRERVRKLDINGAGFGSSLTDRPGFKVPAHNQTAFQASMCTTWLGTVRVPGAKGAFRSHFSSTRDFVKSNLDYNPYYKF